MRIVPFFLFFFCYKLFPFTLAISSSLSSLKEINIPHMLGMEQRGSGKSTMDHIVVWVWKLLACKCGHIMR